MKQYGVFLQCALLDDTDNALLITKLENSNQNDIRFLPKQ